MNKNQLAESVSDYIKSLDGDEINLEDAASDVAAFIEELDSQENEEDDTE